MPGMRKLRLRPQVRKQCYRSYDVRYFLAFLILLIIVFALFSIHSSKYNTSSGHLEDSSKTILTVSKEVTLKDSYNLVTAISSREFEWLLKFIDSLTAQGGEFDLTVWSLDLRDCEFNYLKNLKTSVRIHLHHFPYHFHPLHIRHYHLSAIKPIVLQSAAAAFGEVIWIEPDSKIASLLLDDIIEVVSDAGFVAASSSKTSQGQCVTIAIGINYLRYKLFIEKWLECALVDSCIAKAFNKSNMKPQNGVDMLFEEYRKAQKFSCAVMKSEEETLNVESNWRESWEKSCRIDNVCVLTGNLSIEIIIVATAGDLYNLRKRTSFTYYTYFICVERNDMREEMILFILR